MHRGARVWLVAAWVGAIAVTGALLVARYRGAVRGAVGGDFMIYLNAAREVAAGHSPYLVVGYRYPPIVALLLAPFSHSAPSHVWKVWTGLQLCALMIGLAAFVASEIPMLPRWRRPVLVAFCAVTCLHFWPLTLELFLGQADAFVLAVLLLSVWASTPVTRAGLLGVAGLLKGWSATFGVALLQRGVHLRRSTIVAFGVPLLIALLSTLLFGWHAGFIRFFQSVFGSQGHLVSDSVWGVPRLLFTRTDIARPVFVSALFATLVTAALAAWVAALLVATLRTAGDPSMCMWNATLCVVLLLPASHRWYSLYAVPVLWVWTARALAARRPTRTQIAVLAVALLWWLVQTKAWPDNGSSSSITSLRYSVVFAANIVLCTTSVLGSALTSRREGDNTPHVWRPVAGEAA